MWRESAAEIELEQEVPGHVVDETVANEDDGSDGEEADDGTNDDSSGTTHLLSACDFKHLLSYYSLLLLN